MVLRYFTHSSRGISLTHHVCEGLSECHKGREGVNIVAPVLHYVLGDTLAGFLDSDRM